MEFKSAWVTPTRKIYEAHGETDMALCNGPGYTKQWRFTKEREKGNAEYGKDTRTQLFYYGTILARLAT